MENPKVIQLRKGNSLGILQQLGEYFGGTVSKDCQRHELKLPASVARPGGTIVTYSPSQSIDALIFEVTFLEDIVISFSGDFPAPLNFYTLTKGTLGVTTDRVNFDLGPLQSAVHGDFTNEALRYHFSADEPITCLVLQVHKGPFFEQIDCEELDIPGDLVEVITNMSARKSSFLFTDIFHLPAVNALKDIIEQKNVGLLNSSFATAKIYEVLFLLLREYKKAELASGYQRKIKQEEKLNIIRNAEAILVSHLTDPPTIPDLARMVGTNQQDLKAGFRQLFGTTINQYLTEYRLEQAGILIQSGRMSIGEIAASIGYSSPGYFARKFKEKYGVAPKQFKQQVNTTLN